MTCGHIERTVQVTPPVTRFNSTHKPPTYCPVNIYTRRTIQRYRSSLTLVVSVLFSKEVPLFHILSIRRECTLLFIPLNCYINLLFLLYNNFNSENKNKCLRVSVPRFVQSQANYVSRIQFANLYAIVDGATKLATMNRIMFV